ncbi:hypothetical protein [Microbispora sp. ATCC PTA-5024]|uniref:hypothetical protein n=1 Tax=Microbispora sp. ATCC PTA-5024 TaxID=316330 RepID=UPI0012EE35AB|nr:hypothetical protein [Microbispora sp. ATCC PTA-5024]
MWRLCGSLLVVAGIMSTTTSCSPPVSGMTGVGVDAEGHPIIVLAWCEGAAPPERVSVSHYEDPAGPLDAVPVNTPGSTYRVVDDVNFVAPPLDGRSASVRLDAPDDGWTVEPRPFELRPGVLYGAFGHQGRGDDEVNTDYVSFSAGSVATLTPGSVLVQRYDERRSPAPGWVDVVITRDDFDRQGRDHDCR